MFIPQSFSAGVSKKESGVYVCKGENSDNESSYNDVASVTLTVTGGYYFIA